MSEREIYRCRESPRGKASLGTGRADGCCVESVEIVLLGPGGTMQADFPSVRSAVLKDSSRWPLTNLKPGFR